VYGQMTPEDGRGPRDLVLKTPARMRLNQDQFGSDRPMVMVKETPCSRIAMSLIVRAVDPYPFVGVQG